MPTAPCPFLAAAGAAGGLTYLILNHLLGGREIPTLLRLLRS